MSEYEENEQYLKKQAEMMTATYSTDGYSGVLNEGTTIAHAEDEENAQYFVDELLGLHEQLATAHAAREAAEAESINKSQGMLDLSSENQRLQAENARLVALLEDVLHKLPHSREDIDFKTFKQYNDMTIALIRNTLSATTPPATASARYDEPRVLILSAINSLERIKATSGNRYAMLFDQGVRHPASGDGELDGLNEITNGAFNAIGNMQRMMRGFKIVEEAQRRADELNANES